MTWGSLPFEFAHFSDGARADAMLIIAAGSLHRARADPAFAASAPIPVGVLNRSTSTQT